MKIALLVSGQMRTLDVCLPSVRACITGPLENAGHHCEFFVHAAADEDAGKADFLKPAALIVEPQPLLDEKNYAASIGLGCYGVQVVLRQLWSLRECWRLFEASEWEADFVIRLRPDCLFTRPLESFAQFFNDVLYVPTFHNFYGLNDRFAIGDRTVMGIYHRRLDTLDAYIAEGRVFHPESHLLWTMLRCGIPIGRTNITFDLVRKSGERVPPGWNKETYYGDVPCI